MWWAFYLFWIVAEIVIAFATRTRTGKGNVQDRGSLPLLWITICASMTLCGYFQDTLAHPFPHWCTAAGIVILMLGLAIRCVAIISLGKSFSSNVAIHATQRVYQNGLYSLLRHPSYTGLLLIFFAVGLHARNPMCLLCAFVPPTAALLYRIHVEEFALQAAFGDEYRNYMTHTKRLVPWVY
jgi:protein-S-isoprenylcysteine O-methyltransferase Ste14